MLYVFVINRCDFKKFEIKKYIVMAVPLFVLALPLLLMQLINMGKMEPFSFLIFDFPKLGFYRGSEMSLAAIPKNIYKLWMMMLRGNQFSFTVIPHFNPVYLIMIPFIVGGFVITVKNTVSAVLEKRLTFEPFILAFTFAGYVTVMMISDELNIYTGNELFFMYLLYIIICIKWLTERIPLVLPVILSAFAVCFLLFSNYYFRHYNEECGVQFMFVSTEYYDVVNFANENCNHENKKIYFDRSPQHQSYGEVIVGMGMLADPSDWEKNFEENNMVENVYLGLPDEAINLDATDCIYIFSKETHGHIYPYFMEKGWQCYDGFENYAIIYR